MPYDLVFPAPIPIVIVSRPDEDDARPIAIEGATLVVPVTGSTAVAPEATESLPIATPPGVVAPHTLLLGEGVPAPAAITLQPCAANPAKIAPTTIFFFPVVFFAISDTTT